jgi:hypothetical protein
MEDPTDIGNAIAQLQATLDSKKRALDERAASLDQREEKFSKRVRLFEESHPKAGKESDVLHLNVGGTTTIAVSRRILTQFEDSMLASKFCGRLDDSLEKDKEGNFFIDEDPAVFLRLVNFLRVVDKTKRADLQVPVPKPDFPFCWLLEHYDLMLSVYPHQWREIPVTGGTCCLPKPLRPKDPFLLNSTTGNGQSRFVLDLDPQGVRKPAMCSSLTAVFEKGSEGEIGWLRPCDPRDVYRQTYQEYHSSYDTRVTYNTVGRLERDQTVRMQCIFEIDTSTLVYSVQFDDLPPVISRVKDDGQVNQIQPPGPYISVLGKVVVSDMSYLFK